MPSGLHETKIPVFKKAAELVSGISFLEQCSFVSFIIFALLISMAEV